MVRPICEDERLTLVACAFALGIHYSPDAVAQTCEDVDSTVAAETPGYVLVRDFYRGGDIRVDDQTSYIGSIRAERGDWEPEGRGWLGSLDPRLDFNRSLVSLVYLVRGFRPESNDPRVAPGSFIGSRFLPCGAFFIGTQDDFERTCPTGFFRVDPFHAGEAYVRTAIGRRAGNTKTFWHPDFKQQVDPVVTLSSGEIVIAKYDPRPLRKDIVNMSCQAMAANPIKLSGFMVHEGYHGVAREKNSRLNDHQKCRSSDCDPYLPHPRFGGIDDLRTAGHGPYQAQWELLCDYALTAAVPNEIILDASSASNILRTSLFDTANPPFVGAPVCSLPTVLGGPGGGLRDPAQCEDSNKVFCGRFGSCSSGEVCRRGCCEDFVASIDCPGATCLDDGDCGTDDTCNRPSDGSEGCCVAVIR